MIPDWYWNNMKTQSQFLLGGSGQRVRNMIVTGPIGGGKTQLIKKRIKVILLTNHILILDTHNEYSGRAHYPWLSPDLISVEICQKILNSNAAYIIDLVRCLRKDFRKLATKTKQKY